MPMYAIDIENRCTDGRVFDSFLLSILLVISFAVIMTLGIYLLYYRCRYHEMREGLVRYIHIYLEMKDYVPADKRPVVHNLSDPVTPDEFIKIIQKMLKRMLLLPLFALLTLSLPAQNKGMVQTDSMYEFRFVSGKDMFFIPYQDNRAELECLSSLVTRYKEAITGGKMPGFLFSAAKKLEIAKDDTLRVTAVMQQHIRTLELTLKLAAGEEERITHTAATLTGILSAIDLRSGTAAATGGKAIVPTFTIGTNSGGMRSAGQPVLSASLRLLGAVTGERQPLTLAIAMPDGHVHTFSTDLTEMLKNFGEAEMEPLKLDAGLELPTEAGMSATITDWTVVDNGHIDIH